MRPGRTFLTLALVVAGAGAATADRYSRTDCKTLKVEYADALTTAARSDMEQGSDWAAANLPLERLQGIERLIDLEADLEFRCRMSRSQIAAIKPERKPVIPDVPVRKELPDPPSQTADADKQPAAEAKPVVSKTTVPATTAKIPDAKVPDKKISDKATATVKSATVTQQSPATKSQQAATAPKKTIQPAAQATKPSGTPKTTSAPPNQKVATQEPAKSAPPTKKKKATTTYVSPREVVPFNLYQNGSRW